MWGDVAMNRRERRAAKAAPRLQGLALRYGGCTVEIRAYVNTDEPWEKIYERVFKAVKFDAPNSPMVLVTVAHVEGDDAKKLWDTLYKAAHKQSEADGGGDN